MTFLRLYLISNQPVLFQPAVVLHLSTQSSEGDITKFEKSEVSCPLRQHSISYPTFAPSVPLGSTLREVAFNYAHKSQVIKNLLFIIIIIIIKHL